MRHVYEIEWTLGRGAYGEVVCCKDHLSAGRSRRVAIKIIRNDDFARAAAKIEIKVLQHIRNFTAERRKLYVQPLNWFNYRGHICLTFDLLGLSLIDFL